MANETNVAAGTSTKKSYSISNCAHSPKKLSGSAKYLFNVGLVIKPEINRSRNSITYVTAIPVNSTAISRSVFMTRILHRCGRVLHSVVGAKAPEGILRQPVVQSFT